MKLQIVTDNIELCRLEEHYEDTPHVHENWVQLTYAIRGSSAIVTPGSTGFIPEGRGRIFKPMEEHHIRVDEGGSAIVIKIRHSLWEELRRQEEDCISSEQIIDPLELDSRFYSWISPLFLADGARGTRRDLAESEVLHYLKRNLRREACSEKSPLFLPAIPRTDDPYMDSVFEYIHNAYTSPVSIEVLSSIALQSRYHFIRSFKSVTGVTPYQYILRLRIQRAKHELEFSNATVSAISAGLGFASASQFYRAFVKIVGKAPEQYRLEKKTGGAAHDQPQNGPHK